MLGRLRSIREKPELLEEIHRRLIKEALARGLDFAAMAGEFNQNDIRCIGRPPWTAHRVERRWNELNKPTVDRSTGAKEQPTGTRIKRLKKSSSGGNMNTEAIVQTHTWITPDHLRRLAVVYMRQSTDEQVQRNTGSTQYQRDLAAVAQDYGWPESQIKVIDEDLGKSGSTTERRTGLERLHGMIEADQVGAVFVANISRIGRQVLDVEFFRLSAALHNTLLYSDGRFINPADSNDMIFSQMTAMFAQYENRKRAEVMMQSRLSKARRGEVVSRLPVGWVKGPDGRYD